jgi:hypothetical protein
VAKTKTSFNSERAKQAGKIGGTNKKGSKSILSAKHIKELAPMALEVIRYNLENGSEYLKQKAAEVVIKHSFPTEIKAELIDVTKYEKQLFEVVQKANEICLN